MLEGRRNETGQPSQVASHRYLGARTAFGTITHITDSLYNAVATVQARDGSTGTYRLPFLIALCVSFVSKISPARALGQLD